MTIDPEFKSLLRELKNEEFEALEKSIKTYGCRDSLLVWGDILIDGHNRYDICTKNKKMYLILNDKKIVIAYSGSKIDFDYIATRIKKITEEH